MFAGGDGNPSPHPSRPGGEGAAPRLARGCGLSHALWQKEPSPLWGEGGRQAGEGAFAEALSYSLRRITSGSSPWGANRKAMVTTRPMTKTRIWTARLAMSGMAPQPISDENDDRLVNK